MKNCCRLLLAAFFVCGLVVAGEVDAITVLRQGFANPPQSAGIRCFWWWLNGNVTKEAITRDLEEMKAKGFSGALIFDADGSSQGGHKRVPAGPMFGTPEWRELFVHAVREADRLGLELSLSIQSGWNLGGPDVTPEESAHRLAWSEKRVKGPGPFTGRLTPPQARDNCYRDVAVVAVPAAMGTKARVPIRDLAKKAMYNELGGSAPDCRPLLFDDSDAVNEVDARVAEVLDLTDKLQPDGSLKWDVPNGEWRVIRFGHIPTGAHVSTASGPWQGRVLDYMSEKAMRAYWGRNVEPLMKAIGPLAGKSLRYLHTDSWECGGMNWSEGFEREFEARRGYSPVRWLPVIAGCIIESRDASNAFLADFRKAISDCVADHNYALFAALAREHGLAIHPESAGPHAGPLDGLKNYGRSELMMSEAWVPSPHRPTPAARFFVKQAASAAHIYGKRLVGAEIFTSIGPHWEDVLWESQKPTFDHEICDGLNLAFVHTFTCSPKEMGLPGQEYFAGTHFNPNVTWWPYAGEFTRYLARHQFVVQQGRFVADVLYYYGDHVPNIARRKGDDPAKALPGFDYDVINEELLPKLTVQNGRLELPSGMRYRLLVLPDHRVLSLTALRAVKKVVDAGATVLGPKPLRAVSLEGGPEGAAEFKRMADELWGTEDPAPKGNRKVGPGRIVWGLSSREFLLGDGLKPDCEFTDTAENAVLDWIHYTIGDADIYFVCNQRPRVERFTCRLRVTGKQPELWDGINGAIRDATTFAFEDGRTAVPLELTPNGSLFVVCQRAVAESRKSAPNAVAYRAVQEIAGPWDVSFDPKWGGPESVRFEKLVSWTERPEEGIRFYSGKAVYRTKFDLAGTTGGARLALDLGIVKDTGIARVRLNGQDLGIIWCSPFRVDISKAAKAAGNELEIEVVNSWRNRLVGDRDLPAEKRLTKTNILLRKEWKLLESGLLGPVKVMTIE